MTHGIKHFDLKLLKWNISFIGFTQVSAAGSVREKWHIISSVSTETTGVMYSPPVYKYAVFTLSSAVLEKEKLGCFQAVGLHRCSQSFNQTWLKRLLLAPASARFACCLVPFTTWTIHSVSRGSGPLWWLLHFCGSVPSLDVSLCC